ncbi:MAG TPA: nuclear transport factor 2 family protein [Rubrivivax sp.]|nr:nuclear transport factor 2 family protein [Burkholderiales bacterium]HNT39031.1 nuclear transport factor 2 family protein [Rubrivivax sp.]
MARQRMSRSALPTRAEDVEAQYYDALQNGDLERLMAAWADEEEIVCIHPGGQRVIGPMAVRASFEAILADGGVAAVPEQVRRLQGAGVAVHHLVERLRVSTQEGPRQAYVMVTNVFVHTAQGWRMVAHHASPAGAEPPAMVQEWPSTVH